MVVFTVLLIRGMKHGHLSHNLHLKHNAETYCMFTSRILLKDAGFLFKSIYKYYCSNPHDFDIYQKISPLEKTCDAI